MGQQRVTVELTPMQARILRLAIQRFVTVHPLRRRGVIFERKALETVALVEAATADLDPLPLPVTRRR